MNKSDLTESASAAQVATDSLHKALTDLKQEAMKLEMLEESNTGISSTYASINIASNPIDAVVQGVRGASGVGASIGGVQVSLQPGQIYARANTNISAYATKYCGMRGLHASHTYQDRLNNNTTLSCPGTQKYADTEPATSDYAADQDPEIRLVDRRCRCGVRADQMAKGCQWHPSVSAQYARDLQQALLRTMKHAEEIFNVLGPTEMIVEQP